MFAVFVLDMRPYILEDTFAVRFVTHVPNNQMSCCKRRHFDCQIFRIQKFWAQYIYSQRIANRYWDQLDIWQAQEKSDSETCGEKFTCENCARYDHNIKLNPKEQQMSCFTACKRTQKWRGSRHFRQNSLGNFSPIVPPSAAGFASVASDTGGLLWRKVERSKSLVLLQVGGLTCRWKRHSVKASCWECSTIVEQAETHLRVVVPIEEEEEEEGTTILRSGIRPSDGI
jgi:hypothetical protein